MHNKNYGEDEEIDEKFNDILDDFTDDVTKNIYQNIRHAKLRFSRLGFTTANVRLGLYEQLKYIFNNLDI